MEVTTKKEPKVKVKGNGMNGKIIVQARKFCFVLFGRSKYFIKNCG